MGPDRTQVDTQWSHPIPGQWRTVPKLLPAQSESLVLPTDLEDYGTTRDLFGSIRDLLNRYLTLFKHQDELLTRWCMASWLPDVLDFVPRLTITRPRFAAAILFRVLRAASRRPVLNEREANRECLEWLKTDVLLTGARMGDGR